LSKHSRTSEASSVAVAVVLTNNATHRLEVACLKIV
jgi:hypothetical protein